MVNNGTQKKSSVLLSTLCWEMATVATGTCNINFTQYRALRYLGEHVNDNFSSFGFSNFMNVDRQKGVLVMKNVHEHERRLNVSETLKLL